MRRTARVFRTVTGSEALIFRSGRRLLPDPGEVNKAAAELNGKPRKSGNESRKTDDGTVDRMFGVVYTRKRMRNGVLKSQLSANSDQRKRGKIFNNDVEESTVFAFVVENGGRCHWLSNILCLVLNHLRRVGVGLSELAAFLMSEPLSSVYASNGVHLLWGPPANGSGLCKFAEAKEFAPLFYIDFSAVPCCFMHMHYHMLLCSNSLRLLLVNTDEMISHSEENEPCIASIVDVSNSLSGSDLVNTDVPVSKVVSNRASMLIGLNGPSYRLFQRRRSPLRRRRASNPSLFGVLKNVDSSQCSADILVTEPGQCYKEEGAIKTVPVPGVHEVPGYDNGAFVLFRRPDLYVSLDGDEVSRALAKRTANYDMDSEDEEWLMQFNGHFEHLSEDCFELIVDAFEKEAYLRSPDDNSNEEVAAANLCLDLASAEVAEAVHAYWMEKREKRPILLRVFKLNPRPSRRGLVKRRSSSGRGEQRSLLQAEQNAMAKAEEASASATRSVEYAILKRRQAQLLMQNADMATYKAAMALEISEAARFTTSSEVAVARFLTDDDPALD